MKETIRRVLDYLADEDKHFWENCECPEAVQEAQDFAKCNCEANKQHIHRDVRVIDDWLESGFCPLVDEDELEIKEPQMTERTKRPNVDQETLFKCDKCKLYFSTDFEGSTDKPGLCDKCWDESK